MMTDTKLRQKIKELGLSQAEVARRCQVDAYRLSKIVTGATRAGRGTIEKLAHGLGCSVDEITEPNAQEAAHADAH